MVIKFLNDYKSSDREIKELISDFNKDDRQQITRRTTHGIYIMKQIINELNIKHQVAKEKIGDIDVLSLSLIVPLKKEEENGESNTYN